MRVPLLIDTNLSWIRIVTVPRRKRIEALTAALAETAALGEEIAVAHVADVTAAAVIPSLGIRILGGGGAAALRGNVGENNRVMFLSAKIEIANLPET